MSLWTVLRLQGFKGQFLIWNSFSIGWASCMDSLGRQQHPCHLWSPIVLVQKLLLQARSTRELIVEFLPLSTKLIKSNIVSIFLFYLKPSMISCSYLFPPFFLFFYLNSPSLPLSPQIPTMTTQVYDFAHSTPWNCFINVQIYWSYNIDMYINPHML